MAGALAADVLAAPSGWLNVDGNVRFAGGGTVDWANSGPPGAACANGGVNITGSGGLFNCGRPGAPGAPPIAPTLTPAAAANATIISAVFLVDPIAGDSAGCGGSDPTILQGAGPKNGDGLNTYLIAAGGPPTKDDLANVYAVSHTRPDGHPEVYFGAEKLTNNGDTHMDFEFMQTTLGRTAACGGTFIGDRTQGDLLVSVDFANGGAVPAFSVHIWHCAVDPGPQPPDGTICNPAGGPEHYQDFGSPAFATVTVNGADIPCGGWICRDKDTGVPNLVKQNNFLEGGVDLQAVPFAGCFNTFLPHTRASGSFTATLKDFAGPVGFKSCRDPSTNSAPGGTVAPGASVHDTVTLSNGGAPPPSGTETFFLCSPAQTTSSGCAAGTQVGGAKTLVAGTAISDSTTSTSAPGKYCWRTVFAPDPGFAGIFTTAHTNGTTECFNVLGAALPDTGLPDIPAGPLLPVALLVLPVTLFALPWRTVRSVAVLLVAGMVVATSPAPPGAQPHVAAGPHRDDHAVSSPAASPLPLGHVNAREAGWRLVIPRIGVDAQIQPVGIDRNGAMAAPASLDAVGWFNRGPAPGQPGSAVIDGHYGASQPAVFRALRLLRLGDQIDVVWPDGRVVSFEVSSRQTVPLTAHPAGLFTSEGPARLSLITCSGAWIDGERTYSDRLIVTATLS